jgi:subfamily B ATP-binding cassette protein MsbA
MKVFLSRLLVFVRPYRARFVLGLVCGILYGLANGAFALAVKIVVDLFFNHKTNFHEQLEKAPAFFRPLTARLSAWLPELTEPTTHAGWIFLFSIIPMVMLVRVTFGYLSIYLTNWAAARTIADIRTKLFEHLQNLSLSFFSSARTGELIARVTNDTQVLFQIIGSSFASMVKDPVTIVVLLGVQLAMRPMLTLVAFIVFPVCVAPILIYGAKVRKSARAMQGHNAALTSLMHESFTGNRIIKAYNLEPTVSAQFRATTQKYVSQVMRVLRANEIPSQMMEFLAAVGVAMVFLYVEFFSGDQQPNEGDFTAFIASVVLLYPPIKALTRLTNQLQQAEAASERVFQLLATKSDIVEPTNPVPLDAHRADIHFENVDFDYDQKPVLRNINLTVKAGQLVALVGRTGSGKTTITNLLLRFYDPQKGAVKIGSTDLRQVSTRDLRNQIALVTQETILFNDTIRHNIALGRPGATDAEIEAAAQQANAHEFIIQKEGSYEFMVGEKGVNVSGGQRQRLAIARAILKDAPILILDEATSALDSEVERAVQAELEKLMQGRTTICIAHRLSTIQRADLIVVLSEGGIAETGTHAELLQRSGVYKKLYDLQFQV